MKKYEELRTLVKSPKSLRESYLIDKSRAED